MFVTSAYFLYQSCSCFFKLDEDNDSDGVGVTYRPKSQISQCLGCVQNQTSTVSKLSLCASRHILLNLFFLDEGTEQTLNKTGQCLFLEIIFHFFITSSEVLHVCNTSKTFYSKLLMPT
jgi:hypothetical protein